ncbi:MAG: isocitrate lyase/PEP mutase family protein [Alphaproteobacteria bacterium]|nr:isocitrate lyase/PEP mutase family protein [Alphaproteobacteria bacterium]
MTLSARIGSNRLVVAPGIYDALSALVAEQAGFEALYLSGASIAYTRFGRPDIGLVSMSEVVETLAAIHERVELPIIADADNGFGNALNVMRTVRRFEQAGASAIQLEDQTMPKRCGHLAGKTLIPPAEMVGKIKAAQDARRNQGTLIIARTDAIAVEGFGPALERAERYAEAGADIIFVEAPRSIEEMQRVVAAFRGRKPLLANMVEGGMTPLRDARALEEMGFSIAIFPGGLVRAVARHMLDYFASLRRHGSNQPFRERMLDFDGLNALIGTREMLASGESYDASHHERRP